MATLDERQRAFERKFVLDEELRFKATARRNRLVGLWAAELVGKSGAEAEAYARDVVIADLAESGDEDVVRKLAADLAEAGQKVADSEIRAKLVELTEKAVKQIEAGTKP